MVDTDKIREELSIFLKDKGYNLYHLNYKKEGEDYILHVEIDNHLDLNEVSELSSQISEFMDEKDFIDEAYLLDVYTVGLERILNGHDEIVKAKGQYVFVKLRKEVDGLKKLEGTIKDVLDDKIILDYLVKNIHKQMIVEETNIKLIRLAIKF